MSVAPRAAPSMSERSKMFSRRGSISEEETIAVGAVVVMLSDKTETQNAAAYRPRTGESGHYDTSMNQKDECFMAVLAPNCDTAMTSLQSQPPGTYLLVKEEDAAITVYVKFRQAVRALTLVKGKEVKKNDDATQLAKLRKKDVDQTPVHNLRLSSDAYFLVEHCWKRFLPQVQVVVFELCCESRLDEETKLKDWTPSMISSSAYSLGLMPEACGFYILVVPGSGDDSSASSVIQVRQVEFDFNKFAITVTDGTLKPSALLLRATSFSSKRTFEADFTFRAIRDNFLSPDRVILKETSVNVHVSHQSSLLNCIDISSNDKELAVLTAAESACGEVMPHEPLPDSFLTVLHEMHVHFGNVAKRSNPSDKPALWTTQKMKLVGRIIPLLVELMIASAASSELSGSADQTDTQAVAPESKKNQILDQFAHSMRFDILFMTARTDESVVCRLAHQICQLLGAHIRIPAELVDFIRDLMALFPVFMQLFLRNQGTVTLWKNLHHNDLDKEHTSHSRGSKTFRSFRELTSSPSIVHLLHGKGERRPFLFGLGRKPVTKARKSLSLGTSFSTAPFLSSRALAFFRLSPLSVQSYLSSQLREGYFTFPDIWKEIPALVNIAFCCCTERNFSEQDATSHRASWSKSTKPSSVCARKRLRSSAKMATFELLLQLSLRFLYHRSSFTMWDRDVALLLRLEEVHQQLFDEIIVIVRRRTENQDINTKEALCCELRVAIACVSTLFRLERKRRQDISSAVGDKRYLSFIYSFRTKFRELNVRLKEEAARRKTEECEEDDSGQTDDTDYRFLLALAEVFRWIPRAFLDEWIVLSLRELLQAVNGLSNVIKQTHLPVLKQLQYVRDIHEIFQVFAVMLRRTSDPDIQTILVRALSVDSSVISLLRFALLPHSLSLNGGRDAVCIQMHVLNFLSAFVKLDIALPVRTDWESKNRKPNEEGSMNEDAEIIEQLKGELLIRVLGPRITIEDGDQSDQTLWDFMLELMFPCGGLNTVASFSATSHMLGIAASFRSAAAPPILLTTISKGHFQMKENFLILQQALYTAQDASSPVDYESCITTHLRRIEQFSDRIIENDGQEEPSMVYRIVDLHFRCLIVLANRRSQFPAIQEAFDRIHVLSSILKRLQPQELPQSDQVSALPQREHSRSSANDESGTVTLSLPPLKLPHQFSTDDAAVLSSPSSITKLSLSTPSSAISKVNTAHNFILAEPGLHVLAIVLLVSFVIVDPNLEIDEKVCPRISVPGHGATDFTKPRDLLWTLQQHLQTVEMDHRYLEALMVEMQTIQSFVSTERLSAVRSLLRLLSPNRFDCNLYTAQAREYIAKGAFSTVYRQHPALPKPGAVAVKVVEHQRRAGEFCAISGLFNEVSILSKLRGDLAATQLLDFGNHRKEQCFEIVLEYCPCTLTEWRATISRSDSEVPFRSHLVMILRAFEEACQCLTRIHQAGVCHFDIKSDNILVRSSADELSRRLLENDEKQKDGVAGNDFKGSLCFADFGESKVVDADLALARTFTFSSFSSGNASPVASPKRAEKFISLSRTRGTEAIKSPEVLQIKGSEEIEVKVTLASDVWSLGCLLYELVTQELLFQNDDWAGLYAHLVVTKDEHVLRSDHKQKMLSALQPTCSEEEAVVTKLSKLCSKILTREPTKRPKPEIISAQVRKLLNDVYTLPVTSNDESFITSLQSNGGSSEAPRSVSLQPFSNAPSRNRSESHGVIVPVRLFWNFYIAAEGAQSQNSHVVTSLGSHGPAGKDVLVMDAFESNYDFVHFVYLSWHDHPDELSHERPHFIQELHEEEHRTCFFIDRHLDSNLFPQLVQHSSHYFPVLQRRLREEAGCVVFVALDTDIQPVLTEMLLFFLRSAFNMTAFDVLRYFARDCAQFFAYPRIEFIQHLTTYSKSSTSSIQCLCGAHVLPISSTKSETSCFHPFPMDSEDEISPIDMLVHDAEEEQLVLPFETRSKRQNEVPWVSIDTTALADKEELVRGLQRRRKVSNWKLYECPLCCLPICALSGDKVAVPLQ